MTTGAETIANLCGIGMVKTMTVQDYIFKILKVIHANYFLLLLK
jgi:hypothetical protein